MARFQAKNQIEVQITPHSLVISRLHPSEVIQRVEVEFAREAEAWKQQLAELAGEFAARIAAAIPRDAKAVILYQSPTITCQMSTLPIANRLQAERAARLGCAVATHHGDHATIDDAILVGIERSESGVRSHLVAAADRLDIVEAIVDFAAALGLDVTQIIPLQAVITANNVAMTLEATGPAVGCLHLGRTYSCLTVSAEGKLIFFRQIGFTTQQLVEALMLPIAVNAESGQTVDLDQRAAEELICKFGIPEPGAEIDRELGIRGFHLLSALQSHLQRATVEIKQSLRFGIPDEIRGHLQIHLVGSGRQIPHLNTALEAFLEMTFAEDPGESGSVICSHAPLDEARHSAAVPASAGHPGQAVLRSEINLIPPSVRQGHFRSRFRRGLWAGLAASLLLLVGDSILLNQAVQKSTVVISNMEAERLAQQQAFDRRDEVIRLNAGMSELESNICEFGEDATDWAAVLVELARLTEDDIYLSVISAAQMVEGRTIQQRIKLDGYTDGGEDRGQIRRFVDALRASPLFGNVTMGDVMPGTIFGESMRSFKLEITVQPFRVTSPRHGALGALSAVGESGEER